jgi:hypothetical protein
MTVVDPKRSLGYVGTLLAQLLGEDRGQLGLPVADRLVCEHDGADQHHFCNSCVG